MEIRKYVIILLESLEKKKRILQALLEECKKQENAIKNNSDIEEFDTIVTYKGKLIDGIRVLDNGFEQVYERIGSELTAQNSLYREEILKMQTLISEIMELSVSVQAAEQRNKQVVENYFSFARGRIGHAKKSVRAASEYYKNMSGLNRYPDISMLDKKK